MTAAITIDLADSAGQLRAYRSPLQVFWRRFSKNTLAIVAAVYLTIVYLIAAAAPVISPHSPEEIDLLNRLAPPSREHFLGTDENGRDVFSRLLFGSQVSMTLGLMSVVLAVTIGTVLGAISGYFGGRVDALIMRFTDAMLVLPSFFLALLVLAVFGPSIANVIAVIGATQWMVVARVVRSEVLRTVPQEFVNAAHALGASHTRIVVRHILPQAVPSLIVASTLGVANAILTESALSYLGLGVQPPAASWGSMLSAAQNFIWTEPVLAVYPGLLILMSVLAFNSIGDALRDALDPNYNVD